MRGSSFSPSRRAFRLPVFTGKKPSKENLSDGSPETESAAIAAHDAGVKVAVNVGLLDFVGNDVDLDPYYAERVSGAAQFDGVGYCWIETGGGSAGFASGDVYAEPNPVVPLPRSGRMWHWSKVFFERYWMGEGIVREASRLGLKLGSKLLRIPASL